MKILFFISMAYCAFGSIADQAEVQVGVSYSYQYTPNGKCQTISGEDPTNTWEGYNPDCEKLCNDTPECYGYSKSMYQNCLLWGQRDIKGDGDEWGKAGCHIKLIAFEPQIVGNYKYIPEGKCQTNRHTEPHSIKYPYDLDCGTACDKDNRCYGYSQGGDECRLWTQRDIIGGGVNTGKWEGSSCWIKHEKKPAGVGSNYQSQGPGKCQDYRGEEPNYIMSNRPDQCRQNCNEMDNCYGYSQSYETGNPGCFLWTQKYITSSSGYKPNRWRSTSCYIKPHDGEFNPKTSRSGAFEAIGTRMYNILASRNCALHFLAIIGVCSMIYHAAKVVYKRMLTTEIKRSYNSIEDVVQEEC